MRCHLLSLQQEQWVHGGSIDEIIWLLNKRQRAIEETGDPCLQVLYLVLYQTTFSGLVHPPAFPAVSTTAGGAEQLKQMMSPANLHRVTACDRCCLAQDRIVFVVNQNHWVCVGLDMADCAIIYLDSLSTSSKKVPLPAMFVSVGLAEHGLRHVLMPCMQRHDSS